MFLFYKFQEVLLVGAIILTITGGDVDYCSIKSCPSRQHTMCKYPTDEFKCPGAGTSRGLTNDLRKVILDRHNFRRQSLALGKQYPQPHASNMRMLTWNNEAETIAQRWADQCVFQSDSCRNVPGYFVGQNIVSNTVPVSTDLTEPMGDLVDVWFKEIKDMRAVEVDSYRNRANIKHYAQMVWAETESIGCGFIQKSPVDNIKTIVLYCNYVGSGNYEYKPVYRRGRACSRCPEGTGCSRTYPGLCTTDAHDFGGTPLDTSSGDDSAPEFEDRDVCVLRETGRVGRGRRDGDIAASLRPSAFVLLFLLLGAFGFCHVLVAT